MVVNCVFTRLPMMPCSPTLALMKPTVTKESALVHAGSKRSVATLIWPLFQIATAAAIVKSAWMKVPSMSHARERGPMRSPSRPMNAPALKVRSEQSACWSAMWNVWSAGLEKRRAIASASWTVFPVWKPAHTKIAVNWTASLR